MPNRYEAHITTDLKHASQVRTFGELAGWKFSQIHGCPIMGEKTYCYLTGYSPDSRKLKQDIDSIVSILNDAEVPVLRTKIEHIIWDTKTGVNQIG